MKEALFMARLPGKTDKTAVRALRGYTMGGIEDGWLIAYEHNETPPRPNIDGKLCVVQTADGRNLIRKVRRAWKPGTWDLLTVSGEQLVNQRLLWAEVVTMIVPYELTDEEKIAIAEDAEKQAALNSVSAAN